MTTKREKSKPQKPLIDKQLEAANTEGPKPKVNQRQEKFADYLIDVSKYVLTRCGHHVTFQRCHGQDNHLPDRLVSSLRDIMVRIEIN